MATTISTVNAVTEEFIDQLNENFEAMSAFTDLVTDVPAFTSQFFGVDPPPTLSTSPVGALSEVSSLGIMGMGQLGIGPGALGNMSNGASNVAIGENALGAAEHEAFSVAVGRYALETSEGYENTGVGYASLTDNTSGIQNTGIGAVALYENTTGSYNTGLGSHTLVNNTTGERNTAAGYEALFANTTASGNSAFGVLCMIANTTGASNSAFGLGAMNLNNADNNCAFGYETLKTNVSGTGNSAFGKGALQFATGSNSIAMGIEAGGGALALTASGLVLLGAQAGYLLTGASHNNVMIGYASGSQATTGVGNVLIGASPDSPSYGQVTTGSRNVSIGYDVAVASPTANDQLNISNFIYGTTMSGTGTSISPGKIGLGVKAPTTELDVAGAVTVSKYIRRAAPNTQTGATYTVLDTDTDIIADRAAGTVTLTLPAAASYTGREIYVRTIQAQTVVSATSNVIPLAGGAAGTAILAGTAGKWARLVSDGTNWQTMAAA